MDLPFNIRDFDPPRKQHQQQQQSATTSPTSSSAQFQYNPSPISFNHSNHAIEASTTTKFSASNPPAPIASTTTQTQSSQILKNSYQNLSRFPTPKKLTPNTAAAPTKVHDFVINGPPLKIYEMQQTSLVLNKNYGDFLTITPRRKCRASASLHPPEVGKASATNSTFFAGDRQQKRKYPDTCLEKADSTSTSYSATEAGSLQLANLKMPYETSDLKPSDYRAIDSLYNADTLKLGSECNHRTKFSSYSSICNLKDISTSLNEKPYKLQIDDIMGYANIINVTSPPSAFSDTPETDVELINPAGSNVNNGLSTSITITKPTNGKHCPTPRDYTIAV